ncbi:MAG: DNA-processing protein DprA [Sphingobacteriaceae bacterium]|nr:MAG: DNA-processing protein DprA [Sphingobacteriaceae bacterium]
MKLSHEQIIFLTYLTDYDIPFIYRCIDAVGKKAPTIDELTAFAIGLSSSTSIKGIDERVVKALAKTREAIDKLKFYDITPILYTDRQYPKLLHNLKDKPPILYLKGKLKNKPLAAVVGSRDISAHAARMTISIVDKLLEYNFGIASGLALGIDTIAHYRAVQRNAYTIAVLPNSLEKIYPNENFSLATSILEKGGALVSELIFGINRGKRSFVQRNRIQSGISNLVVPVEMGRESGTMHTIDFAMRQKRKIFLLSRRPDATTENDGVQFLIEKFSKTNPENVFVIKGINDFIKHLAAESGNDGLGFQTQLF